MAWMYLTSVIFFFVFQSYNIIFLKIVFETRFQNTILSHWHDLSKKKILSHWHDLCLTLIWKHVFKKRTKKNLFGSYFINKQVYLLVWMIDWDLKQQLVWTSQLFYLFKRLPLNLVLCFQKTPKICFLFYFLFYMKIGFGLWKLETKTIVQQPSHYQGRLYIMFPLAWEWMHVMEIWWIFSL